MYMHYPVFDSCVDSQYYFNLFLGKVKAGGTVWPARSPRLNAIKLGRILQEERN